MIRLIKTSDFSLHVFEGRSIPEYAILSHRWGDGEITFQELQGNLGQGKPGWLKVQRFCRYAEQRGHQFVWIDTCCIDKSSSAELSEAINSMFRWYRRAERCYAYLCDVPAKGDQSIDQWMELFKSSEWFTRGWTLQELLAPRTVIFVCSDWEQEIGTRESLSRAVSEATRIPEAPLTHGWTLNDMFGGLGFSVAQIMSWASDRCTTRVEDAAYSLMGLFCINMPLLYGEGQNAFIRLQLQIMNKYDDNSLFAWKIPVSSQGLKTIRALNESLHLPEDYTWGGLLAPTVRCFQSCTGHFQHIENDGNYPLYSMTSRGVQVEGLLRKYEQSLQWGNCVLLPLNCGRDARWTQRLGLVLSAFDQFAMRNVNPQDWGHDLVDCDPSRERHLKEKREYQYRRIFVQQAWLGDFD